MKELNQIRLEQLVLSWLPYQWNQNLGIKVRNKASDKQNSLSKHVHTAMMQFFPTACLQITLNYV